MTLLACQTAASVTAVNQLEVRFGEWSVPVNIGPPLNTADNDSYAILSEDGLTLYFTSDRPGGFGGDDIWVSRRATADSPWGTPVNLGPNINTSAADSLAVLNHNERVMYFHSTRPGGCGLGDLWKSRRADTDEDDWSVPENLGCVVNTAAVEIAPAFFVDDETDQKSLYFGSNRAGGIGDFDIYQTFLQKDGTFGPGVLVPGLSSPKRDTRTFVRRDGREVFITSDRDGGNGLIDLWVSTRDNPSNPWNEPTNLGAVVNSSADDGSPFLSRDNKTLYFFSARPGGFGKRDIWITTRSKLHAAFPFATGITFDRPRVSVGSSYTATFTGDNLTDKTYFDVRFRPPRGTADEVVWNAQQGISAEHTVVSTGALGVWTVTGVRAHQDINDHSGAFVPVSATITVIFP
jgi:hypothetical protein